MAAARGGVRNIAKFEGVDFLSRRFAEVGVRNLPIRWVQIVASKLPKRLRESNDVQEELARGLGMLVALGFGLSNSSENAFSGAIEEALEEIAKQVELHPEGAERRTFVRSRMSKLQEELEKVIKKPRDGKTILDVIAEDLSSEEQAHWQAMFYTFPEPRQEEFLRSMGQRGGISAARLRLMLNTPESKRYQAFLILLEQAPLLKESEKGVLDRVLSRFGTSAKALGPEGKHAKGFIEALDRRKAKLEKKIKRFSRLGY